MGYFKRLMIEMEEAGYLTDEELERIELERQQQEMDQASQDDEDIQA